MKLFYIFVNVIIMRNFVRTLYIPILFYWMPLNIVLCNQIPKCFEENISQFKCISRRNSGIQCSFIGTPENLYILRTESSEPQSTSICLPKTENNIYTCPFTTSELGHNNKITLTGSNDTTVYCQQSFEYNQAQSEKSEWKIRKEFIVDRKEYPKKLHFEINDREKKKLKWDIRIKSEYSTTWTNITEGIDYSVKPNDDFNKLICHIFDVRVNYSNVRYKVEVRFRTQESYNIEEMWSEYTAINMKSVAYKPERPPDMTLGSFNVAEDDDIISIYWRELRPEEQNGDKFKYNITKILQNGIKVNLTPFYVNNNMAQFVGLYQASYEFSVVSQNVKGISYHSTVKVTYPRFAMPHKLKLIYLRNQNRYRITWESPSKAVTNYTVFSCEGFSRDLTSHLNKCDKSFDFEIVNVTEYFKNSSSDLLRFAVAANYKDSSSGMQWITHITRSPLDLGELIQFKKTEDTTDEMITVIWSLDSADELIVDHYNLEYCPIERETGVCEEGTEKYLRIDKGVMKFQLTNLEPETEYRITLNMSSIEKESSNKTIMVTTTQKKLPTYVLVLISIAVFCVGGVLILGIWIVYELYREISQIEVLIPKGLLAIIEAENDRKQLCDKNNKIRESGTDVYADKFQVRVSLIDE